MPVDMQEHGSWARAFSAAAFDTASDPGRSIREHRHRYQPVRPQPLRSRLRSAGRSGARSGAGGSRSRKTSAGPMAGHRSVSDSADSAASSMPCT